jgi:hypothetical protein
MDIHSDKKVPSIAVAVTYLPAVAAAVVEDKIIVKSERRDSKGQAVPNCSCPKR